MNIFPSYVIGEQGTVVAPEDSLWGGNDLCRRCGQYRMKMCAWGNDGFSRCRRGLSVVKQQNQVWFGLRIAGFFNRSIRLYFGFVQFELTQDEAIGLIGIAVNKAFIDKIEESFVSRNGLYMRNLNTIWRTLANVMRIRERDYVTIDDATLDRVENAFAEIAHLADCLGQIKSIATGINSKLSRLINTRVMSSRQLLKSLNSICDFNEKARKWLHDEGQYIPGLQNLIGELRTRKVRYPMEVVHSVCAITYVLNLLRRHHFEGFGATRVFPLFKLFDRYHYCMLTSDVTWDLRGERNERFDECIKAVSGFEFVVSNLLDNAIKYLPKERRHRIVKVKFFRREDNICVEVQSLGPPRTPEELLRIGQQEGYRGETIKLKQYRVPGKGMGANQIREYVTRSHFRITYDSTGPIVSSNGLVYKWFIANIEIPSEYIVPTGVYEEYEQLD